MSKISCLCALALLSISQVELEGAACTNTWNAGDGNWGAAGELSNWLSGTCVPGEPGTGNADAASFVAVGGPKTIKLANFADSADVSPLLNSLTVTNFGCTFQQGSHASGVLQLTNSPSINLSENSSTIQCPVTTDSSTSFNIDSFSSLIFDTTSSLTGTGTLNVNTTGSNSGGLFPNSSAGFADNMSIVFGAPGGTSIGVFTNSGTGTVGSASPSIIINDQANIGNLAGTFGGTSTVMQVKRAQIENGSDSLWQSGSFTKDGAAFPLLDSGNITNNGTFTVTNDLSIINCASPPPPSAPPVEVGSANENTVSSGNGCSFTVGGNFSFDAVSVFSIQNLNLGDVNNGSGGSIGAFMQVNGTTPGTFTVHGGTQIGNNNEVMTSNTITAGNTGVFFDGTNADLVYAGDTHSSLGTVIQSYNSMDIVGGGTPYTTMGSRMEFRSLTMTSGFIHVENAPPGVMSGDSGIGTLFRIHNDVSLMGDLSQLECAIGVENDGDINGTNNIGNWFDITNGNLNLASIANAEFSLVSSGTINGMGNIGALLSLDTGNLTIPSGNSFILLTEATVQNGSIGSKLLVNGTFQTSGLVINNGGPSVDNMSIGTLIRSPNHPIQVLGGYFINNDRVQTDNVPVSSGALLAGSGIYQGATTNTSVVSDGTVYPGTPFFPILFPTPVIGTMTIDGTYTQNSDGTLFINIQDVGTFSKVKVLGTGTADLQGTVTVGMLPGAIINATDTYNILETLNGITNPSLNPIVVLDPSYTSTLIPQIRYITGPVTLLGAANPNIVQLFFLQGPTPPTTAPLLTSYSFSFETLFDLINRDNLILEREMQRMRLRYQREYVVSSRRSSSRHHAQANATRTNIAFDQIPSIRTVANKIPDDGKDLAFARYRNEIEQQRMDEEMVCTYQDRPWNFFIGPVGDVGTIKTKKNQIGSDYWVAGALTSFNYVFSQGGIGLFADYNKVKADVHRHWGNFNFDMAHSCLYGTYSPKQVPDLAFHSIVGGSYEWYNINRKTTTNTAKGKTHGGEFDALFTGEYVFAGAPCSDFPEHLTIIPRAGLQYLYVNSHHYKEHGAGVSDLMFKNQHAKSLRSILDLWMKYSWEWTNVKFTPELNVGWQREFFDYNRKIQFTPVSVALPTSSVRAFGAGRNTFLAGLDLFLEFYEKYALEASYDFQWNSLIRDNGFYLGFHARF